MEKTIKGVLERIEDRGFEAYVVGGYVRDQLVGKSSYDIDICTNATPKDLIKIFPKTKDINLGGISFKIKEFNFDITTYREELKYENRRPVQYNYINNLLTDLQRRDFTINTICMNKNGDVIDLLDGVRDLNNLTVKMVGNINKKLKEDPLRILRAIRLATVLNFKIDDELYKYLLNLSNTRTKEELDKILISENALDGLGLMDKLGVSKLLGLTYQDIVPVKNIEGMYAQIEIKFNLAFTKIEKESIKIIKKIINGKEINNYTLYKYGLYYNKLSGAILNYNLLDIDKCYKKIAIHNINDIDIKAKDIIKLLGSECQNKLNKIMMELEKLILSGKIKNKRSYIEKYLINNKTRWL